MNATERYRMLAAYNAWANERIYDAAEKLPDADYRADRGAFFKSMHGTLNHMLVADRLWMHRFMGDGLSTTQLDEILFEDLAPLRDARRAEDRRIIAYVDDLDAESLVREFTYRTVTNPTTVVQPLAPALDHFFNHHAHHRGQAHCLLTAIAGRDFTPSLDLILFQRKTGIGLTKTMP